MMSAKNAIQPRDAHAQESFRIFSDGRGHWCAHKNDGMVAGTFVNRDAAIRFVRKESAYCSALKHNVVLDGDIAMTKLQVPTLVKVRRFSILAQLAFVGFLLMGRVAASVIDASVVPSVDAVSVSDSASAGSVN